MPAEPSPGTPRNFCSAPFLFIAIISLQLSTAHASSPDDLGGQALPSAFVLGGSLAASSTCTAVRVQLHRSLADLRVLITAGDAQPSLRSVSRTCSLGASLHDSPGAPEVASCSPAADVASGSGDLEEHWLRIDSACAEASISIVEAIGGSATVRRRRLRDAPPGYVLVSNMTASSPAAAHALARNVSAALQTQLPADPATPPGPPQQPPVQVACCCGQNTQNTQSSAQSCCCGPISACCQQSGFCANSNCTAIFVGSTLVAGTIISLMTCGVCVYRARAHMRGVQSRERSSLRLRARRPMRLLPVRAPPAEDEGTRRDCPVCLEEISVNADWVVFPCGHGTCRECYQRLVGKLLEDKMACPMCRAPLAEVDAEPSPVQPLTRQGMDPVMAMARSPLQDFRGQLALQLSQLSSQHASVQPAGFAGAAPRQAAASSQPAQEAAGSLGQARLSQASSAGSEQQVVVPLGGRQELRRAVSRENAAEGSGQGSGERWAQVPL